MFIANFFKFLTFDPLHNTAAWHILVAGRKLMRRIVSSAGVWTNPAAALGAADVTSRVWQSPIWCKRFRDICKRASLLGRCGGVTEPITSDPGFEIDDLAFSHWLL